MSYSSAQRVFYDDIYDEILPIHKKSFKVITDGSNIDLRLILERVKRGDCVAKYSIGANFYNGVGTQRDLELSYKYTKEAAEDGYVPAMTNLAILYLNGHGIEKDMQKSLGWFGAAALQGDYRAQCNLGYLYESEPELSHDVDSCIFWYKKSSDNGYILARISLALLYTTGVKVVEDRTKAEQLLSGINLSDDILSHIACSLLSMLYLQGRGGVPRRPEMALKLMRGVASRGYHLIEGVLGETLISGEAGENNPQEGIHWLRRAAERGAKDAQHSLAMTYLDGTCGNKDLAEASIWFRRAADQGYVYAQKELFRILYDGIDVVQDIPQALEWLRRAAEQNDEEAQYRLGLACYNGDGVPQDYVAASNWFQRAAENGSLEAQFNLGWMYTAGFGVIKDVEAGLRLYENAATQGLVDAQLRLSAIYDKGENVNEDKEKAEKWLRLAAQGGNLSAQIALIHRYANKPLYDKNRSETDINEILKWCRAAAAQGHAESEENAKKIEIYLRDTYNKEVVDVKKQLNIELLRTIDVLDTQWSLGLSESEKSSRVQRMTNAFFSEEREESLPPAGFGGVPSQEAKGQATDIQQPAANKALLPQTWEEAKAQLPGLKKWSEAKETADQEGRKLTIIDHLRDTEQGYGAWTLTEPGLPRAMLKRWGDNAAYVTIYSYLRNHDIPSDVYIPADEQHKPGPRQPRNQEPIDPDDIRAARRLLRRAERAAAKGQEK